MDLLLVRDKRRPALVPATSADEDRIRSIRFKDPMQAKILFLRTGNLQRWYWGLLGKIADAIDANAELLHSEIKFRAGLVEQVLMLPSLRGGVAVRLSSTAYPAMDQTSFARYVDVATEILCRDYVSHIRSAEQQKLILDWVGHRPK